MGTFNYQKNLEGSLFTVRMNHSSFKWILNLADCTGRLARLRVRLAEFNLEVVSRTRILNQAAEALSRLSADETDTTEVEENISTLSDN